MRLAAVVAYDGAGFRGFAAQPEQRTVAGELAHALGRHLRQEVTLTCAGRTDAGVHAAAQVITFDVSRELDSAGIEAMVRSVNRSLAPAVVIRSAFACSPGFDARHSATGRRYRYQILNAPVPDPWLAPVAWHVPEPLDLAAMRLACDALYGEHDFSAFCRKVKLPPRSTDPAAAGEPAPAFASLVRMVRYADWRVVPVGDGAAGAWTAAGGRVSGAAPEAVSTGGWSAGSNGAAAGRLLCFEIEASSFCQQMVRSVVGTMVEIGRGKRKAGEMMGIIAGKDRSRAGQPAPAHGLCLWDVTYPDSPASPC